jgi:hypothetical protein
MSKVIDKAGSRIAPCARELPLWLILFDNIPTLCLYVIGTIITYKFSPFLGLGYLSYSLLSIVWFWARICPSCPHFGTKSCPCGYGFIAARFFKGRDSHNFQRVFRMNIIFLFPSWFLPLGAGTYSLIAEYSIQLVVWIILFFIIGFLFVPLFSKMVGCKNCSMNDRCPRMQKRAP